MRSFEFWYSHFGIDILKRGRVLDALLDGEEQEHPSTACLTRVDYTILLPSPTDADDMSTSFVDIAADDEPIPVEPAVTHPSLGDLDYKSPAPELDSTCLSNAILVALEPQGIAQPESDLGARGLPEPELDQELEAMLPNSQSYIQSSYVFEDGDMRLLVDGVFYRIHSHFIDIHSPSLRDRCDTMDIAKGEDTLVLTLVSSEGFSDVLWIFYDETLELVASPEKWLSILLTAEKLQMAKIIDLAVTRLNRLTPPVADPISIIIAQHRYRIRPDWADTAYVQLCKRYDSLNDAEVDLLGTRLVVLVSKAREAALRARRFDYSDRDVLNVVSEFGLTFEGATSTSRQVLSLIRWHWKPLPKLWMHFTFTLGLIQLLDHQSGDKEATHSIRLEDVDEVHFSWFLWILYDRPFTATPDVERWTAIYSIAEKFDMAHIQRFALTYIKDVLTPVERLVRAAQFNITGDLFNESMRLMCHRGTPLTKDEGERLGADLTTRICQGREDVLSNRVLQLKEREMTLNQEILELKEREASLVKELSLWEREPSDSSDNAQELQVSPDYYLSDGDLFVATVFRIHSYFIKTHSPLLSNSIKNGVGSTVRNPLKITTVSESQFQRVLWVFYDETFERIATSREWLSILMTAEALNMEHVVDFAVHKLSGLPAPMFDDITLILVHERYRIREDWATEAYCRLCKRDDPLSMGEAELLGYRLTTLIARAREAALKASPPNDRDKAIKDTLAKHSEHYDCASAAPLETPPASEGNLHRGDIKIKVGALSFQFHRHFLVTHSPLSLALKIEGGGSAVASEDSGWPLLLGDVDEASVADLAWLFYDRTFSVSGSAEQWARLRDIAQKYSMNHVGAFATKQLGDKLSLVERISSLQPFKITGDWAVEVMEAIYGRDEAPSVEEGKTLGLPSSLDAIDRHEPSKNTYETSSGSRWRVNLRTGYPREAGFLASLPLLVFVQFLDPSDSDRHYGGLGGGAHGGQVMDIAACLFSLLPPSPSSKSKSRTCTVVSQLSSSSSKRSDAESTIAPDGVYEGHGDDDAHSTLKGSMNTVKEKAKEKAAVPDLPPPSLKLKTLDYHYSKWSKSMEVQEYELYTRG
ncbi:hypothetical protein ONZ45_g11051 [Pleurotus djamor]|nr:hypothetical protein ONZ45_g11051 [Pleurotus djamor]